MTSAGSACAPLRRRPWWTAAVAIPWRHTERTGPRDLLEPWDCVMRRLTKMAMALALRNVEDLLMSPNKNDLCKHPDVLWHQRSHRALPDAAGGLVRQGRSWTVRPPCRGAPTSETLHSIRSLRLPGIGPARPAEVPRSSHHGISGDETMAQTGSSDEISDRLRAELEHHRGQWVLILNGMVVGHSFDLSAISQPEVSGRPAASRNADSYLCPARGP